MGTAFDYQVRVLSCSNCGAPLQAALAGGQVACGYCHAANVIATRDERPVVELAPAQPIPEDERLRRLRAQQDDSSSMLPELRNLIAGPGIVPPWKMQEALAVWQSTRRELATTANYATTELFVALTTVITQSLDEANDADSLLRQRAMLETTLDAVSLPRQRQVLRASLSRTACRIGDLEAASRWIALCDPRSEDIQSDSHFRVARACLDTARGNFGAVLEVLGARMKDVPLYSAVRVGAVRSLAAVLRANAWERSGNIPDAVAALREMQQARRDSDTGSAEEALLGSVQSVIDGLVAKHASLQLCTQSRALFAAELAAPPGAPAPKAAAGADARERAKKFPAVDEALAAKKSPLTTLVATALAIALGGYAFVCPPLWMSLMGGPYRAAVANVATCPAARDLLGDGVHLSWLGFPYGSNHGGEGSFRLPITGSKSSAKLDYSFDGDSFSWTLPVPDRTELKNTDCKAATAL